MFAACTSQAAFQLKEPLSAKGLSVPVQGHLSANAGVVDLNFTLPEKWPLESDQTLFHIGDKAHTHVTLFCRNGVLVAVYKADSEQYASVNYAAAHRWVAGSRHRVQFQWQADGGNVPFYLRVDGQLLGCGQGRLIRTWPSVFYLGIRGKHSLWTGTIDKASLSSEPLPLAEHQPGSRIIEVDATQTEGILYNFWSIANYTRQDPFTNQKFRVQQKILHPFMRYVNCVRLLGGRPDGRNRWFLGLDERGELRFDFSGMTAILQGILDAGYKPRIVLDNVPLALSGDVAMNKYGNTSPPQNYALWETFVEKGLRSMVDTFGLKAVASWRFRVGTEPDLDPGHWSGTPAEYKHHYIRTVAAVQRVIPEPDIGPGNILDTKHGKWGVELVDYIAQNKLPMTFFSSSWYGRVGEDQGGFEQNIKKIRSHLNRYERFKELPLEIAEFAILHDEYKQRLWSGDVTEWGASWYAEIADKVYRLKVAQVHQWATTSFGMRHPRSHLHTMLGWMSGGTRLGVSIRESDSTALAGAIAAKRDGSIYLLLYNHRPLRTPQVQETVQLKIIDPRMKPVDIWQISEWRVDRDHGVFIRAFVEDCRKAGLTPLPDSAVLGGDIRRRWGAEGVKVLKANINRYRTLSKLPQTLKNQELKVQEGGVAMKIEMPGHSVRLLKLTPPKL